MKGYISISEAAKKWGISSRRVNDYCVRGRILGAQKFGRSWAIPADVKKPQDPRKSIEKSTRPIGDFDFGYFSFDEIANQDMLIALGEIYARGKFQEVIRTYEKLEAHSIEKLEAAPTAIAAFVSLGSYEGYHRMQKELDRLAQEKKGKAEGILAEFALASAAISMSVPEMVPEWFKNGEFRFVSPKLKMYAPFLYSKYFYVIGQDVAAFYVANTALTFCNPQTYELLYIYLNIMAACACCRMGRQKETMRYLERMVEIALPKGYISPLAEHLSTIYSPMKQILLNRFPNDYFHIESQCESTVRNWVSFHNYFAKAHITEILTLREGYVAQLLVNGLTYEEVATQLSISKGTLNNIVTSIYQKLHIQSKHELCQFVL